MFSQGNSVWRMQPLFALLSFPAMLIVFVATSVGMVALSYLELVVLTSTKCQ